MSGKFTLAVEEAKRFRQSLANVWEVLEYVSNMEHPEALDARIKSLRAESQNLIASYYKQAEAQVERDSKGKVEAAERKAKSIVKDAEGERTRLINQGQVEANRILADARRSADQLDAKFKPAQPHLQKALG